MTSEFETNAIVKQDVKTGVGSQLRAARLKQELTLNHVSEELRIRVEDLKAIENEDYAQLPCSTYTIGFIRSYASFLGLNPRYLIDQIIEAGIFEDQSPKEEPALLPADAENPPSLRFAMYAVVIVIIVLAGVLLLPSLFNKDDAADSVSEAVQQSEISRVSENAKASVKEGVSSALSFVEGAVKSGVDSLQKDDLVKADEVPSDDVAQQQLQDIASLREQAKESDQVVTEEDDLLGSLIEQSVMENSVDPASITSITLTLTEDVWFQIYDAQTKESYFNKVVKKGETRTFDFKEGMMIDIGRPEALLISMAGKNYGATGPEWGGVIKRLPFNPEYLINTFYGQNVNETSYSRWLKKQGDVAHTNG